AIFAGRRLDVVNPIAGAVGGKIELGVRPEFVRFASGGIPATVTSVADAGRYRIVDTQADGHHIKLLVDEGGEIPSAAAFLHFDPDQTRLYRNGWLATDGATS
ncbi:MAG: ABC transporter ATP-binding protein, partial [Devosia sp.]